MWLMSNSSSATDLNSSKIGDLYIKKGLQKKENPKITDDSELCFQHNATKNCIYRHLAFPQACILVYSLQGFYLKVLSYTTESVWPDIFCQ